MEFLKGVISDETYAKLEEELKDKKDIKLGNLGTGAYIAKDKFDTQKTELDNTKTQLVEANKQIDSYKSMDIETIKKNAEEYKTKFEQAEKDFEAKTKDMQYDTALDKYLGGLKIKDDVHAKNLKTQIKEKKLQFEEDKLIGGDDIIKSYKEKYPSVFEDETPPPQFGDAAIGNSSKIITGDPDKMDYNTYKAWRKQN